MNEQPVIRQENGTLASIDNAAYKRRLAQKTVDKRLMTLETNVEELKNMVHKLKDLLFSNSSDHSLI
jgi:hypothetical protein